MLLRASFFLKPSQCMVFSRRVAAKCVFATFTPTAMGLAHLYQPSQTQQQQKTQKEKDQDFYKRCLEVEKYINQREIDIKKMISLPNNDINQVNAGETFVYTQNNSSCEKPEPEEVSMPKKEVTPKKSRVRRGNLG